MTAGLSVLPAKTRQTWQQAGRAPTSFSAVQALARPDARGEGCGSSWRLCRPTEACSGPRNRREVAHPDPRPHAAAAVDEARLSRHDDARLQAKRDDHDAFHLKGRADGRRPHQTRGSTVADHPLGALSLCRRLPIVQENLGNRVREESAWHHSVCRTATIRSAAWPSQRFGRRPAVRGSLRIPRTAAAIRSGLVPTKRFVPWLIVIGRSVFSRRVRHGTPTIVVSS
jgi:hypothetical protein